MKKKFCNVIPILTLLLNSILFGCNDSKTLTIIDSSIDTEGVIFLSPENYQNHPDAGQPEYVYLTNPEDGVFLLGPPLQGSELFYLQDEGIEILKEEGPSTDVWQVTVNDQLSYRLNVEDFEDEISLAFVEVILSGNTISSRFYFVRSITEGVAHDITISAFVNESDEGSSEPYTIESRDP